MSSRNVGAVALVILLGLVIGTLGLVEADLYAVGVLLLFLGGVGAAVLAGEYLIRYFSAKRHALAAAGPSLTYGQLGEHAELEGQFQAQSGACRRWFGLASANLCLRITWLGAVPGPRVPLGGTWKGEGPRIPFQWMQQ